MALKPDRDVLSWDLSRFFVSLTNTDGTRAQRGGVVSATGTVGSGASMDQTTHQCWYGSGGTAALPLGMLMNDVVNVDLTRQILNPNKSEAQLNDKVTIMRKGWAVTNWIDPTVTGSVTAEAPAYLVGSGYVSTTQYQGGIQVGKFMSAVDEDGYAKVYIDI